jgi:Pyruvate/2-oxoacid:ferredoxin oxidoreductase delta subunit
MKDPNTGKVGGYQPERNPTFKKFTTRTMRPVVNFDTCIKCTLCWLQCPDSCFDVTPEGLYDANMEACCWLRSVRGGLPGGQLRHDGQRDPVHGQRQPVGGVEGRQGGLRALAQGEDRERHERSHGFRFRGQYAEQVPDMLKIAREG